MALQEPNLKGRRIQPKTNIRSGSKKPRPIKILISYTEPDELWGQVKKAGCYRAGAGAVDPLAGTATASLGSPVSPFEDT